MSVQERILTQQPYSGVGPFTSTPEPEEILAALAEVRAKGITDRDSARIVAFAWNHGIEPETAISLFRERGTQQILHEELGSHEAPSQEILARISNRAFDRLGHFSLAKELGAPDLGWAIAVLIVAEEADFDATLESLSPTDDPSRIATFFMGTRRFLPPERRPPLMTALLKYGDPFSIEVAITLLSWWIERAVEQDEMPIEGLLEAIENHKIPGAIVLGGVLNATSRYESPPYSEDVATRAQTLEQLIDSAGKKVFADSRSVNTALKGMGLQDLNVLAAMSRWRTDPIFTAEASKAIGRKTEAVLEREFSSRQNLSADEASLKSRVSKWSVNPLVEALRHDGIDVTTFQNYFDSLATDSFSKMTRVRTFYEDRQRAIILLAVAARVAITRADAELLRAIKDRADRLSKQPAGHIVALDPFERVEIEEKSGIRLPEK